MCTALRIKGFYFFKEALLSFRRNLVQNFAAVTSVGLCLLVLGIIMLLGAMGRQLINKVEQQVEIEVFLSDTAPTKQVSAFGDLMLGWPQVRKVTYVSKAEALIKFKREFRDQPDVLENLQGNPLPASYRVWLKNPRQVTVVAQKIKKTRGIHILVADLSKDIKYGQGTVAKLFRVTSTISMVFGGLALLLVFVSLVLITNTIRLAIFARRREIGIMKLVGASNWFVRWPFLLEGMIQGLLGSAIAVGVLVLLYRYLLGLMHSGVVLSFMSTPVDGNEFLRMLLILTFTGAVIGAGGSAIALRKFLKV